MGFVRSDGTKVGSVWAEELEGEYLELGSIGNSYLTAESKGRLFGGRTHGIDGVFPFAFLFFSGGEFKV